LFYGTDLATSLTNAVSSREITETMLVLTNTKIERRSLINGPTSIKMIRTILANGLAIRQEFSFRKIGSLRQP